jgi:uncharacterized radical SAM superfamily Fe-S cluster-containing enzyme
MNELLLFEYVQRQASNYTHKPLKLSDGVEYSMFEAVSAYNTLFKQQEKVKMTSGKPCGYWVGPFLHKAQKKLKPIIDLLNGIEQERSIDSGVDGVDEESTKAPRNSKKSKGVETIDENS